MVVSLFGTRLRRPVFGRSLTDVILAALLVLQTPVGARPETPASLVNRIHHAIEVDSLEAVERDLGRAAASGSRLARFGVATVHRLRYQLEPAERELRALLAADSTDQIASHAMLGLGWQSLGRQSFDSTAGLMLRAAGLGRRNLDSVAVANALVGVAFIRSRQGSTPAALEDLARADSVTPASAQWLTAMIACNRASIMAFGGHAAGEEEMARGLRLAAETRIAWLSGDCYQAATNLAINRSGAEKTIEALADSSERYLTKAGEIFMRSVTRFVRGYGRVARNDVAGARRAFRGALEDAARSRSVFATGWVHRFMGDLHWLASDLATAEQEFAAAEAAFRSQGDLFGLGGVTRARGQLVLELGRIDEAERIFQELLRGSDAAGNADGVFASRVALAAVRMARRDWPGARRETDEADRYAKSHGYAGFSPSLRYFRGLASLRLGQYRAALTELRAAAVSGGPSQFLDRYAARSRVAEALIGMGDAAAALAEIRSAGDELDSLRTRLDDRALQTLVFQTRRDFDEPDVGFATVVAGLVRAGYVTEAFDQAERRRGRQLLDGLARARTFEGTMGALSRGAAPAATGWVPAGTALIEFVTGRNGQPTTVFLVTADSVAAVVVTPVDSVRGLVEGFSTLVQAGSDARVAGQSVWRGLLAEPLARLPESVRRLIVVADDGLYHLPFEAVPDSGGRLLMDRFVVSRAPSARVAAALAARPGAPRPSRVLAIGDPAFSAGPAGSEYREAYLAGGGLPRLPNAGAEAREAARGWPGSLVLVGADASESALKATALDSFAVIHFATHAVVDEHTAARTSLALAAGPSDDGFLVPGELAELRLSGGLVVLSACRTATGMAVGGEGLIGFANSLLSAGARAVVATRWPVGDEAASRFMASFYRRLKDGRTADDALRETQLDLRGRGVGAAEWAAFEIIGDGSIGFDRAAAGLAVDWARWPGWLLAGAGLIGVWMARRRLRARAP